MTFWLPVFFLNFSSAGKGPFMASKAKNVHQRCTFLQRMRGSGVRDMALPLLRNLGAKLSEMSFPHFKTYLMQIQCSALLCFLISINLLPSFNNVLFLQMCAP